VYAEFTAMCILMNLPNMRPSRPWSIAGSAAMFAGLLLSLVRSAWLAVIVGTILFTILSPQRIRAVRSLGTVFAVFAALAIGFFTFVPSDGVFQTLTDRVNTLSDISDDASAKDRAETSRVAFEAALGHPLGQGLGLTGSSGALAGSASALTDIPVGPIDNGFVSRFLEMGAPGFAAFLAAILMALALTYRALRVHLAERDRAAATVAAAAFATQAALFLTSLSGDVYAGVGSVLFFIAFGLGVKRATVAAKVRAPKRPAARIPARV
jgi:O-antigen ligase